MMNIFVFVFVFYDGTFVATWEFLF